ncbi:peptidoglycan recognition protein family protein [Nonomuraea sp. CA-143628]|uniref:peptidoglycan recognition protein family protein n=1 Tax=Nonomuraea sp. CA-143628 TaxID=3239997 RepID=UPI003D8BFAE3
MPWLTQLADVARRTGYPVTEVPGWKTRGHGSQPAVRGIVAHHTAGRDDLHVVRDGRPGLDGPLSQFWLKHDGTIYVVAAGKCWHNAPSTSANHTNSNALGIEAENNGREPWPAVQLDAYKRLCAELCREFGLPATRVKGHKEVQPGKPDPHSLDMNTFRSAVAALMAGTAPKPTLSWMEQLVKDLPLISPGDNNYDVKTVRGCLFARGRVPASAYAETGLQGWLESTHADPDLVALVHVFQRAEGLDDDGYVGQLTWPHLLRVA